MDIKIREVGINDHEDLCKIYAELDECHRLNHPELFIRPDGYERAKEYISEIILILSSAFLSGNKDVALLDLKYFFT